MLAIINYNLVMVRLIFVLFFVVGCDQIHHQKHNIRVFLGLSTPTPTATPVEPIQDFSKEAAKIVEITPERKIYNLLNGFINNAGAGIKNILIREFQVNGKIFKNEDPDLISNLTKLAPLIQDGNMDALEIAFQAYANLEGVNQEAIAPIVASGFDYQTKKTLELYLSLKKDQYCILVGAFGKDFDDEKRVGLLESRKVSINEVLVDTTIPESLKVLIKDCEKSIMLELTKVSLKKIPPPMPTEDIGILPAEMPVELTN